MSAFKRLLTENHSVSEEEFERAVAFLKSYGGELEQIIVSLGISSEENVFSALAKSLNFDFLSEDAVDDFLTHHKHVANSDSSYFEQRGWLTFTDPNGMSVLLTYSPNNEDVKEYLSYSSWSGAMVVCSENSWRNCYSRVQVFSESMLGAGFNDGDVERLKEMASEAPVVNLVNSLIVKSLQMRASDLHIEPHSGVYRARARVDGVLRDIDHIPKAMSLAVISRIKILSAMDIAEKRRPQDGKIATKLAGISLDIRVSSLPLNEGESVVMRFLLKESVRYELDALGISEDIQAWIHQDLAKTSGVILLTGPTGSGKTTSLYSFLNKLNNDAVKIITLEDPVEYQLDGINQIQVNPAIGFDFARGLKSILRQDPDILMLGEIRDAESAKIALQSALTGHLVFSTVHTNDAAGAYTRLLDLGVEEFLLNAALVSVMAQRLVRKNCHHCLSSEPNEQLFKEKYQLEAMAKQFNLHDVVLKRSTGCKTCNYTGYLGRVAIIEYLRVDDDIRNMPKGADFLMQAKRHMQQQGVRTLYQDGMYKALQGVVTIDEVMRVVG